MNNNTICADFAIVGAGIIGLSIARQLIHSHPAAKIVVLEKENRLGVHASGRNSGVLHSGIYYKNDSLKAKLCLDGSRAMAEYCDEHHLPIHRVGKIILPRKSGDKQSLDILYQRSINNGAKVHLIDGAEIRQLEPAIGVNAELALYSPETSIIDPKAILSYLHKELIKKKVVFHFNSYCTGIDVKRKTLRFNQQQISYNHLFNAAGLYADNIARSCGLAHKYRMLPFKGIYYELAPEAPMRIKHLIYPVPDMNMPFLGVHFTKSISGQIYVGPTAIPAFGRENYTGFAGIEFKEIYSILSKLGRQYLFNRQGFRAYTHQEISQLFKSRFVASARLLIPSLNPENICKSVKVGIRAQLFDCRAKELVMDFLVKQTENATHVLNAVSPAFTS